MRSLRRLLMKGGELPAPDEERLRVLKVTIRRWPDAGRSHSTEFTVTVAGTGYEESMERLADAVKGLALVTGFTD